MRSRIFSGTVVHHRLRPKPHKFRYQVTAWYLDLDELPVLDRELPGFGWNRAAPISFHDCDHGARDGGNLRRHIDQVLAAHDLPRPARIGLLCYPRMLGYAFNPLSVYFCHDAEDRLLATLHEVSNTFGQTHTYLIPGIGVHGRQQQTAEKRFYVSPFMPMECRYRFRLQPPSDERGVGVAIRQSDDQGPLFNAAFVGRARPLGAGSVAALLLRQPFMTLKVTAAIHWEALRLWLKGVPLVPRPKPPRLEVSRGRTLSQP